VPDGWKRLSLEIASCTKCPELATTRTHTVAGDPPGPRWSGVVLVGEAPGADEDRLGRPFIGASGRLLDDVLAQVGLPRDRVAVVNVLRCRPPANRPPKAAEVKACRPWLEAQLAHTQPKIIVTLGTTALQWFLGRQARIGAARQLEHEALGAVLIPTYHPSAALRFGPRGEPAIGLREDLARVAALVAK